MLGLQETRNSKKQGDIGLVTAIWWFERNGCPVSIPLTDSQDYDLVADVDGKLSKVQVRTTYHKKPSGIYKADLRVRGGNRSGTGKVKHFDPVRVDYMFVVTNAGDMYLIPSNEIANIHSVTLGEKYEQYRVT